MNHTFCAVKHFLTIKSWLIIRAYDGRSTIHMASHGKVLAMQIIADFNPQSDNQIAAVSNAARPKPRHGFRGAMDVWDGGPRPAMSRPWTGDEIG